MSLKNLDFSLKYFDIGPIKITRIAVIPRLPIKDQKTASGTDSLYTSIAKGTDTLFSAIGKAAHIIVAISGGKF